MAAVSSQLDQTAPLPLPPRLRNGNVSSCGSLWSPWRGRGRGSISRQGCKLTPRAETDTGRTGPASEHTARTEKDIDCMYQSESKLKCKETNSQEPRERQTFLLGKNHCLEPAESSFSSCLDWNHFSFRVRPCSAMGT